LYFAAKRLSVNFDLNTDLLAALVSPGAFLGHAAYGLLVLSMMMRNIVWLRIIALASGVAQIAYDALILQDPVSVGWDAAFVLANAYQMAVLAWQARKVSFSDEELMFCQYALPLVPPLLARQFLDIGVWQNLAEGSELTRQDEPVEKLTYIASGTIDVLVNDHVIATCENGDFIGELGILSGKPATATTVSTSPARVLVFERDKLFRHLRTRPDLKLALHAAFKENLRNKLTLANQRSLAQRATEPLEM
jgi:CRP-like cAMP-binding protein